MPSIDSRLGVDTSIYKPVDSSTLSPASATATSGATTSEPTLNPYLRCPIPPVWQSSPDSLRQFYQGNRVPQTRLFNPSNVVSQGSSTLKPAQNVTNVTQVVNSSITPVSANQNANLISNDGTSGSRQFYQTGNPDITPPISGYIYQNTNGTPLLVCVSADGGGGGFKGVIYCDASATPTTKVSRFSRVNDGSSNPNYYPCPVTFLVPTGYYYGISVTNGGATPVGSNAWDSWTEWIIGEGSGGGGGGGSGITQLTGDVNAGPGSGSQPSIVVGIHGASIPVSETYIGTNSSGQIIAATAPVIPTNVGGEIVAGSGTSFTLAFLPIAGYIPLLIIRVPSAGGMPLFYNPPSGQPGFTISGTALTLVNLSFTPGTGDLQAWYVHS